MSSTTKYTGGKAKNDVVTTFGYTWFDGPQQARTEVKRAGGGPTNSTDYVYDQTGTLIQALISEDTGSGTPTTTRDIMFANDVLGQVIRRDEQGTSPKIDLWYRFDGRQLGYKGNSGTSNAGYSTSIDSRTSATGSSRTGGDVIDFGQSYRAINSYSQAIAVIASRGDYRLSDRA